MIAAVRKMFPVAYLKKGDVSEEYATLKMHVLGKEINIDGNMILLLKVINFFPIHVSLFTFDSNLFYNYIILLLKGMDI